MQKRTTEEALTEYDKVRELMVKDGINPTEACKKLKLDREQYYRTKSLIVNGTGAYKNARPLPALKAKPRAKRPYTRKVVSTHEAFTVQVPLVTQKYPVVFMDIDAIRELLR